MKMEYTYSLTTSYDGELIHTLRVSDMLEAVSAWDVRLSNLTHSDCSLNASIYTLGAGAPGDRFTEAAASRSYLISKGVRAKSITAVAKGRDTYRSIEALSKVEGIKRIKEIIIVTDPYHCLRSMTMANDFGFNATCSPTRVGIASLEEAGFRYLLRESGAYLAYLTLGRRGIHISDHVA